MNDKDRELMERYIYEVVRRVPHNQRQETEMELRELIGDMAENMTMEAALEKLGNPREFARQYQNEHHYVISPAYYDDYIWALKIVLLIVLGSTVLSALINGIFDSQGNMIRTGNIIGNYISSFIAVFIGEFFSNAISGSIFAFGFVTLIFAMMERRNVKVDLQEEMNKAVSGLNEKKWKPEKLEPVPDKKARLSRSESVLGILFNVIFAVILLAAPQLFGAYVFENGELLRTIPVLNLDQWYLLAPFFLANALIGLVDEMVRLITGCYTMTVMISKIVTSVLQFILSVIILKCLPFWNPNFMSEVEAAFDLSFRSKGDILSYLGNGVFSNVMLSFISVILVLEVGTTIYKTLKYSSGK